MANPLKSLVGERRFELPTSCSRSKRANQAALLPDRQGIGYMSLGQKSSPPLRGQKAPQQARGNSEEMRRKRLRLRLRLRLRRRVRDKRREERVKN